MKKKVLLLLGLVTVLAVVPCQATSITFAQFSSLGANDFVMTYISGSPGQNVLTVASRPVLFLAWNGAGYTIILAHLTLNTSSSTPATLVGGAITQGGYSGTFSFTRDGDNLNLLSGTFGPSGRMSGTSGGQSATLSDAVPPNGEVLFTSAFFNSTYLGGSMDITNARLQAFAISMSSVIPGLTLNGANFLNDFRATAGGTFSADFDIPEAGTSLLVGFGLLGLGFLRKRKSRA